MTLTFFSALCALALHATLVPVSVQIPAPAIVSSRMQEPAPSHAALPAPEDTVDVYFIDNREIAHFDGSQLNGKTIVAYRIGRVRDQAKRTHVITTSAGSGASEREVVIKHDIGVPNNILYVIDGKKTTKETFQQLKPEQIKTITVMKEGYEAAKKLYNVTDKTVIIVTTTDKSISEK